MNTGKDAISDKFKSKLDQADARIDLLKAKADEADAKTRIRLHEEIEDLKSRRDSLRKKLEGLRDSSGDAWRDLQAGAEAGWRSLSNALERAASRFG